VRSLLDVCVAGVLTAFAPAAAIAGVDPSATIVGTVALTAADGRTSAGDGARVVLTCGADATTRTEVADDRGAFRFLYVSIDSCSIEADVQGFGAPPVPVVAVAGHVVGVDLHLGIAPLRVGVNVGGTVSAQAPNVLTGSCRSDTGRRLERSATRCGREVRRRRPLGILEKGYGHVTSND
jgi:hypothetical protein